MATSRTYQTPDGARTDSSTPSSREVVELLNDDYARQIMTLIRDDSKPARALAEECGASRATVYRRLNRLRDAGLVDERLQYEEDGHHRKVFHLAVDSLSLTLDDSGLTASVS